jgi:two-component system, chemotaxis family, protein-glutamate methylesterase/glutaminase
MPPRQLVVIGTSAGGIEALRVLVTALPREFAAPIAVVMHTSPESPGILADILDRTGPLHAVQPRNGERLQAGRIYVAPPDFHLMIEPGIVRITKGPRENRFRPAIDPLFRSAAQVYGPAALGVILTGNLDDGTAGLWAIKQLGGVAIVQDPDDAMFPSMPRHALEHVPVDHRLPLAEIGRLLVRLTTARVEEAEPITVPKELEIEVKIAMERNAREAGFEEIAEPSKYACPECHGVLLQLKEAARIRFRCHTGHAYSADSLLAAVGDQIEDSMWNAIRSLEEGAMLMQQLAMHLQESHGADAQALVNRAQEAQAQSNQIRMLVTQRETLAATED